MGSLALVKGKARHRAPQLMIRLVRDQFLVEPDVGPYRVAIAKGFLGVREAIKSGRADGGCFYQKLSAYQKGERSAKEVRRNL